MIGKVSVFPQQLGGHVRRQARLRLIDLFLKLLLCFVNIGAETIGDTDNRDAFFDCEAFAPLLGSPWKACSRGLVTSCSTCLGEAPGYALVTVI